MKIMKRKQSEKAKDEIESNGPRYPKEVFAERGDAIYEKEIRPRLSPNDKGKFVAIDIETGEYELARDDLRACDKLRERIPDAQVWLMRVGYRAAHSFGGHALKERL